MSREQARSEVTEAARVRGGGGLESARSGLEPGGPLPGQARFLLSLQQTAGNRAVTGLVQGRFAPVQRESAEGEEPLQGRFAPVQRQADEEGLQMKCASSPPAQLQPEPVPRRSETGLPDRLKSGNESLCGISLDEVRVHYGSPQPAQLNGLAYTQDGEIHVAPGQEQHLPHEAWHVVQRSHSQSAQKLSHAAAALPVSPEAAGSQQRPVVQFELLDGDRIVALLDEVSPNKADTLPNYVRRVMAKAEPDAKKPPKDKQANEAAIGKAAQAKFPQFAAQASETGSKKVAVVRERKKLGTAGWNHIWRGDIGAKGHPTGFHWKGKADDAINEAHGTVTMGAQSFYKQAVKLKERAGKKGGKVDGKEVKSVDKPDESTFFPDDWVDEEVRDAIELRNSQDQITTPKKGEGIALQKSGDTIYPVI